jgi:hypothetical protein
MAPIRRNKNRSHQNQQWSVVPDWQPELKLREHPDPDHVPEDYSDVVNPETDVLAPETYQDMERRLPPQLLRATRHEKLLFMRRIVRNHLPAPAKGIMVRTQSSVCRWISRPSVVHAVASDEPLGVGDRSINCFGKLT